MLKKASILSLLFLAQLLLSQEEPKIGLILSGGGAKGLAHIGALKIIDSLGIQIDYVGGTSMGAIIGGLYAAGYSGNELDSIFKSTNLPELIQDNVPRSAKTFYEKDDSERYALSLPFDNFKVSFPEGISGGQNIYNEFVRLLYHVKDIEDFNKLPIPFLCIATNIETGKPVLLEKGYLPEAIMASGTLPSLFEPSEVDGQILIDGGVVNNYPLDEVKARGAKIIIGVDVQDALAKREDLSSATEILVQINNYRTVNDMVKKVEKTDVYLKPNIKGFSVIDFEQRDKIIESGEVEARKHINTLKEIVGTRKKTVPHISKAEMDSLTINRLILTGNDNYTRAYIKGKLRFSLGDKIPFEKLRQGMGNLSATGNFKAIRYKLVSNGLGTDLVLNLRENPNTMYIKMGAHYDDLFKSAALINLTKKNLLFRDDVASFDVILGDHVRYNFQYYLDKGFYWSFGINSNFTDFDEEIDFDVIRNNFDVVDDPNIGEINLDVTDLTNQVYLQTVLREEFAFRMGLEHKLLRYSTRTLSNIPPPTDGNEAFEPTDEGRVFFEDSNYYSTYGRLTLDTYDDKYFPTKGLYFDGDFHWYLFSSDFNNNFRSFSISKARMGVAFQPAKNLSLNIETEGGFKLGTSPVTSFDFVLGGFGNDLINNFIPFFGYEFLSLPGNSFVKAFARLDYKLSPKSHLLFAVNVANIDDDLFRTGEWFTAPDFSGYGVGYGLESFIGPVQIYYSFSPQINDSTVFFSVGYWF
jgi:NTE family protein